MSHSIVIHAGMPKAGSSSLQAWLRSECAQLRERGHTLVVAPDGPTVEFTPYRSGGAKSGWIVEAIHRDRAGIGPEFVDGLARAVDEHGSIIVTAEGFSQIFWRQHGEILDRLDGLADGVDVRVAYYVRPQHTALEAAWRQWGFRSGKSPSAYIEHRGAQLHYERTAKIVSEAAPRLDFAPRPFRADLLTGGGVVSDFADAFLGIEDVTERPWMNRGLPLQVANILQRAPEGMFWTGFGDNSHFAKVKRLAEGLEFEDGPDIELSRRVLQGYAHARYQGENDSLGWTDFVPAADDPPGLEALDDLWSVDAGDDELAFLFTTLQAALSVERER